MSEPKEAPAPWERQPNEGEEAWLAFRAYRDMVPSERMIKHSAVKALPTISKWYRDHNWRERVEAYDRQFDKIAVEERERIYRRKAQEIAIDHMIMLSNARELVQRELAKINATSRETEMHGLVKVSELNKLMETVVKLDRLVRDEPTEIVGSRDLDYSALSPDELDKLNELLDKATRNADPEKAPSAGHANSPEG